LKGEIKMSDNNKSLEDSYTIDPVFDFVIDAKNNTYIALRKVGWFEQEPKLELRKWIATPENDVPKKGVSFLTEDGPHTLTSVLVEQGFGDTGELLESLSYRKDFNSSMEKLLGTEKGVIEQILEKKGK